MQNLTVAQLISNRLNQRLHYLRNVRVFNNVGRQISSNVFQFSYGNWTSTTSGFPVYYKTNSNGSPSLFTPDAVDSTNGTITVNTFNAGDEFTANYEFTYFTDADLTAYLLQAMSKLNNIPPSTNYTLDDTVQGTTASYDYDHEDFLTNYAYKLCLEAVLVDLMQWRAKVIWSDPIALAGVVQSRIDSIDNQIAANYLQIKGRRGLAPWGISIGRSTVPSQVNDATWQKYSIVPMGN